MGHQAGVGRDSPSAHIIFKGFEHPNRRAGPTDFPTRFVLGTWFEVRWEVDERKLSFIWAIPT